MSTGREKSGNGNMSGIFFVGGRVKDFCKIRVILENVDTISKIPILM